MRRGGKHIWEGEHWIVVQEKVGSREGKNSDKIIVRVKLVIQKKKN
jgi:hypothetical protein